MTIDLKKLTHALTVQRLGSFSRAADELHLTQPTLSRSISSLETLWGVQIFERDRTGVTPTRIGQELLKEAAQLLAEARTLDHNMKRRADARAGSIAFGMSPLVGTVFMADILASVLALAPDLKVTAKIETLAGLIGDMKSDHIEFCVFSETELPQDDALGFEVIGGIPVRFLARAGHALASRGTVKWDELAQFPLVSTTPTRIPILPREPTIVCDDYGIAKACVLRSDAIWLSSPWAARAEIASGQMCELNVLDDKSSSRSSLWLASPKNRLRSPAATMIIAELTHLLASMVQNP